MSISLAHESEMSIGRGGTRAFRESRLGIPDRWLSKAHARLQDSFGRWILHDEDSKNGCRVNGESVKRRELRDGDLLELGRTFFIFREEADDGLPPLQDLSSAGTTLPLTINPELAREIGKLTKLAATDVSILILGESGSGKDVLAQRIHRHSQRTGEFVPVNCGALPAGLVESELFGHKKGAFSGAVNDHIGLVRGADKGTLFLDEIADLPGSSQATMLRVLQEKEVRAVGATRSHTIDLHTIAATHLDLDARVASGEFRRDLFARIAGYRMTLPSLAHRREDLGLLIAHFLAETSNTRSSLSIEAARALLAYSWPLNIRELRACLATATVLAGDARIELDHLPEALREPRPRATVPITPSEVAESDPDQERRLELLALLEEHQGNVSAVARAMDKDRKQIQRWLKRFAIDIAVFRER